MALKFDWSAEIDKRLQLHSLSVMTTEDVLVKNAVIFNNVLREVHGKWPRAPFKNLILSLHDYYSMKFLTKILDAHNKAVIISELKASNPYGVHRKSSTFNRSELSEAYSGMYDDLAEPECDADEYELFGVTKINKEEIAPDGISSPSSDANTRGAEQKDKDNE